MGLLFCKDKNKDDDPNEMIVRLRITEEMVQKKIAFLEKKIEEELAVMKKVGRTNKRAAMQALGRKKRYEKQIQQLDGTLCTLEFQREALESATMNKEVLGSMQSASKAMKGANQGMSVDKINALMDEIHEQRDIANEVAGAISTPMSTESDDDELMAELNRLEQEDEAQVPLRLPDAVHDPPPAARGSKAPEQKEKKSKKNDEEDMDKMQAWLA